MRTLYKYLVTSLFPSIDLEVGWRICSICFTWYFSFQKMFLAEQTFPFDQKSLQSSVAFTRTASDRSTNSVVNFYLSFILISTLLYHYVVCFFWSID